MSIANEITRIQQAKEDIKAALISKGCPVLSSETIDDYAKYINMMGEYHDYSQDYLTFTATESGTFKFIGSSGNTSISYSLNNGSTWISLASNTNTPTVSAGNKILWKGALVPYKVWIEGEEYYEYYGVGTFSSTGQFAVEGNVMSLLYEDNFIGQTSLSGKDGAFVNLFNSCTTVTSAENLSLPATTLASYCYRNMFYNCTNLTTAPQLPATTLADVCYFSMFKGCTSLTTAPQLPATTLAISCYGNMFNGCTSLTTAPELPATTLADSCYFQMFCGCTSLTTAPTLPATTLTDYCYFQMFNGCTSLNSVICLATDISAMMCTEAWVASVAASGTFTKAASMSSWTTGANGIPSGWSVVDVS